MKKTIYKADDRGRGDFSWLTTRYSFSFSHWYDPARMGFGALRVINDDVVAPDTGFGKHEHNDMEIITIVTEGTVTHRDSMGNIGTVTVGEVQVMSAGTGVTHSEYNDSKTEPLKLFQIWIDPRANGLTPRYDQKPIPAIEDQITTLVSPDGTNGSLMINQDAFISMISLSEAKNMLYSVKREGNGLYFFVVSGTVEIDGLVLSPRDAMSIAELSTVRIDSRGTSKALVIEVPI